MSYEFKTPHILSAPIVFLKVISQPKWHELGLYKGRLDYNISIGDITWVHAEQWLNETATLKLEGNRHGVNYDRSSFELTITPYHLNHLVSENYKSTKQLKRKLEL